MYNVLIADDHLMVREGIKHIISKMKDYTVIAEADNGADTLLNAKEHDCHLLLIDINMPDLNGIEVLKEVKAVKPQVKAIILTMYNDRKNVQNAVKAGADGYLLKDDEESTVLTVIKNVMLGISNFSPKIQSILVEAYSENGESPEELLSPREFEVFTLIAKGMSHKEIANKAEISVRTVDFHIRNIKDKLYANSTVDLVRIAYERDTL